MTKQEKPLVWIGGSNLMALPVDVRKFFGHALDFARAAVISTTQRR